MINGRIKIKDINAKDWFAQVSALKVPEYSHAVNKGKCPYQQGSLAALFNRTFCGNGNVLKHVIQCVASNFMYLLSIWNVVSMTK